MSSELYLYSIHAQTGRGPIPVLGKRIQAYSGSPFSEAERAEALLPGNLPPVVQVYQAGAAAMPNVRLPIKVEVQEIYVDTLLAGHTIVPVGPAEMLEYMNDASMGDVPASTIQASLDAQLITPAQASAGWQRLADLYLAGQIGGDGNPIHPEVLSRMTGG